MLPSNTQIKTLTRQVACIWWCMVDTVIIHMVIFITQQQKAKHTTIIHLTLIKLFWSTNSWLSTSVVISTITCFTDSSRLTLGCMVSLDPWTLPFRLRCGNDRRRRSSLWGSRGENRTIWSPTLSSKWIKLVVSSWATTGITYRSHMTIVHVHQYVNTST